MVCGAVSSNSEMNLDALTDRHEEDLAGIFICNASFPGKPTNELITSVPG
jgi:hypothetical protein